MATPAPLTRHWRRHQELGPKLVMGEVPAAADLEFFAGTYLVLDVTTGLAVRPLSTVVNASTNLRPLGLVVHDKFSDDPDNETHVLDTRGLPDGRWESGHLVRGLTYWKNGIFEWQLDDSSGVPIVGEKAHLVDETLVRTQPTSGLWVGRFHKPLANGNWLVDHQLHGVD